MNRAFCVALSVVLFSVAAANVEAQQVQRRFTGFASSSSALAQAGMLGSNNAVVAPTSFGSAGRSAPSLTAPFSTALVRPQVTSAAALAAPPSIETNRALSGLTPAAVGTPPMLGISDDLRASLTTPGRFSDSLRSPATSTAAANGLMQPLSMPTIGSNATLTPSGSSPFGTLPGSSPAAFSYR